MIAGRDASTVRKIVLLLIWLSGLFFPVLMYVIDTLFLSSTMRMGESILLIVLGHLFALALCVAAIIYTRFETTIKVTLLVASIMALGLVCLVIAYYDISTHPT